MHKDPLAVTEASDPLAGTELPADDAEAVGRGTP